MDGVDAIGEGRGGPAALGRSRQAGDAVDEGGGGPAALAAGDGSGTVGEQAQRMRGTEMVLDGEDGRRAVGRRRRTGGVAEGRGTAGEEGDDAVQRLDVLPPQFLMRSRHDFTLKEASGLVERRRWRTRVVGRGEDSTYEWGGWEIRKIIVRD